MAPASAQESGFGQRLQDLLRDVAGQPRAIEDADAVIFAGGEFEIPAADGFEKALGFALDPVGILAPAPHAREGGGAVEVEQECQVGEADSDGEAVDPGGHFRRDHPGNPLIDGRRIEEPVGDHGASRIQRGADHFPDELGPAGRKEEKFGFGGQRRAIWRLLEQMPDHLAGARPSGLAHQQRLLPPQTQGFREEPDLGGLPASLRAFKCEEKSFGGRACFHRANVHTGLGSTSMKSRKICFVGTEPEEEEYFSEKFGDYDISFEHGLRDVPEEVEVVSIFLNDRITEKFLACHPKLRMISTRSMGCDHIDLDACAKRRLTVAHVSGYGENTVAEHTFALMLALSRRIRESTEAALAGKFTHEKFRGMDLRGSTLGVVGAGRVGLHVIRIAGAFGMKVLAYDAHPNPLHTELLDFKYTSFDHLIRESHVITLHIPLNQETHHIFNRETLSRCRPGVLIVNTARGRLIDSEALIEALDNGQVGGAGLDVIEEEGVFHGGATALLGAQIADRVRGAGMDNDRISLPAGRMKEISRYIASNALLRRAKVVFTPHNAYNSDESREFISNTTSENILNYFAQNPRTTGS